MVLESVELRASSPRNWDPMDEPNMLTCVQSLHSSEPLASSGSTVPHSAPSSVDAQQKTSCQHSVHRIAVRTRYFHPEPRKCVQSHASSSMRQLPIQPQFFSR